MSDKCRGFFGQIRCHFEARYDQVDPNPDVVKAMATIPGLETIRINIPERYVCDVCTACGEQRGRPS